MDELVESLSRFKMGTRRAGRETIGGQVPANREVQVDQVPVDRRMPTDDQVPVDGQVPVNSQELRDRRVPVQRAAQPDEEDLEIETFKTSIKSRIVSSRLFKFIVQAHRFPKCSEVEPTDFLMSSR